MSSEASLIYRMCTRKGSKATQKPCLEKTKKTKTTITTTNLFISSNFTVIPRQKGLRYYGEEFGLCPANIPQGMRGRLKERERQMCLKSEVICQHLPLSIPLTKVKLEHPLLHWASKAPFSNKAPPEMNLIPMPQIHPSVTKDETIPALYGLLTMDFQDTKVWQLMEVGGLCMMTPGNCDFPSLSPISFSLLEIFWFPSHVPQINTFCFKNSLFIQRLHTVMGKNLKNAGGKLAASFSYSLSAY